MDALLHPRGPEGARTYWIRRALVLVAALVVLALVVTGLVKVARALGGSGDAPTAAVPAASDTPESPSATGSSESSAPEASPSVSASEGDSSSPATSSSAPSASASSASASATPTPSATPTKTPVAKPTGPIDCDPKQIEVQVTGARRVKSETTTSIKVAWVNRDDTACHLDFGKNPFKLVVTSGSDRIWSTEDCAAWGARGRVEVKPGKAHQWSAAWNTRRSKAGCKLLNEEYLRPGTYVITGELSGGDSSRWVMLLVG